MSGLRTREGSLTSATVKLKEKHLVRAQEAHRYALNDRLAVYEFAQDILLPGEEFLVNGEQGVLLCSKVLIQKDLGTFYGDLASEGGGYSVRDLTERRTAGDNLRGCCYECKFSRSTNTIEEDFIN